MKKLMEILDKYNADIMILPNCDDFSLQHCANSLLHKVTGFLGTAGEGIVLRNGEIYLFIDPRYHIQAQLQAKEGVKVIKMKMGEKFLKLLKKYVKKGDKILIDEKFIKLSSYHNMIKEFKGFCKIIEGDFEKRNEPILLKSKEIEPNRIKVIKKLQKELKIKNIFISDLDDVSYLSGISDFSLPYSSAPRAKMFIKGDEINFIEGELPYIDDKTAIFYNDITLSDYKKFKHSKVFKKNPIKNFASIKSSTELKLMRENFKKLDVALYNFEKRIQEGMSEVQLKDIFESELYKAGAKSLSFKTILSIDENTASIHYSSYDKNKILKKGSLILLDCGGYYENGIATDITRVFCLGEPSEKQKEIYTLVLKAYLNSYNTNLKTGFGLDNLARKIFSKYNLRGFEFPHALGHGVGVNVHSAPPTISPTYRKTLKANMTFSVEPGLYKEGEFGIRLENTVYIDKNFKKTSFSKFHFEKKLINYDMLSKKEIKWLSEWV